MIGIPGRALAAVSAIGLAASLTGCQFVEVGKGDGDSSATHPATSQEVKSTLADTQAAAGSTDPVEVDSELPVVATRQTSDNDIPLSVTLNSVSVTGGITTVIFSVANDTPGSSSNTWSVMTHFSDGSNDVPLNDDGATTSGGTEFNTDGVTVLDTSSKKIYRSAYDTAGGCLCSSTDGVAIARGATTVLQTSFAAVPDDVDTVTVTIPMAGAFENVPVTR